MAADPGHDYYEANVRAHFLPAALAQLDRSDLVALFRLAEALAAHPRLPGLFAWYQAERRTRLAGYVRAGLVPARILDRL